MITLLNTFQSFRAILCVCPCCGDIVRISDLHLKYKGVAPKTWLDEYESKVRALEKKEEKFQEKEKEMRIKAHERGRKKVDEIIRKSLTTELVKLKYNPYDIQTILHPVDYVVFDGLKKKNDVSNIVLLSHNIGNTGLHKIQKSIKDTIEKEKYDWRIARVSVEGKIKYE